MITKILVANRGEIACRVIRTARDLGFRTVAVYSDADRDAPHALLADEAVHLGPAPVAESYLDADKILAACRLSGADAVHPGYGFLSENARFAEKCADAGVTFIGPPADAIALMGSKRLSKLAMQEADVPCIPGYEGEDQSDATFTKEARRIGFPIMIKASAGGGGRGMRLALSEAELAAQIKTARSEALNAFGSDELILEKALLQPRHIEIQVFADTQGAVLYLGERDCSVQRRHQKVVEEAPSPFVDADLRERMGAAAVKAAQSCGYVGAGTVEFLVDQDKRFYFLEMNTRLQVEHPVTELVTGFDLVAWQIQVAAGASLPVTQDQVRIQGHAMEVRLYAEDPQQNFLPQTGSIQRWRPALSEGVRIDDGVKEGQTITPHYDPMLAKIIAWGADREQARRRLQHAVEDSLLFGVIGNQLFLANILKHPAFQQGEANTGFLANEFKDDPSLSPQPPSDWVVALAALIFHHQSDLNTPHSDWRSAGYHSWPYELRSGDDIWELALETQEDGVFQVRLEGRTLPLGLQHIEPEQALFECDGLRRRVRYLRQENRLSLHLDGAVYDFEDLTHAPAEAGDASGDGSIRASMDGRIVDVLVEQGQNVEKGATLVVLEAMKMEHPLKADISGVVEEIKVKTGDQVRIRELLVTLSAE
ncbi:acetyl/propionyl/methylcrotonyl-CoA carboxylase subunit alpha [Hahella aquimaris]|uniref:acetyl/propionyl/methylcrotonyl-CoA carboxylase subunit alpha n=1 Tax=Hahella sp. HNIBRBA332 TaxID=3015983 RepID=UPI00273B6B70|nr:acetyl/propionyl/methylcrotonyl-CoA carboxylase subunit alpha [Hahella sp. HNIBRBA332]WLQ14223.1 acetyl/propionyl/methylcrotonyl-CoA carboxylase subunit alpha [Hahella sp. HNIBRBA332]